MNTQRPSQLGKWFMLDQLSQQPQPTGIIQLGCCTEDKGGRERFRKKREDKNNTILQKKLRLRSHSLYPRSVPKIPKSEIATTYYFLIGAVAHYHKLSDLKPHKFIIWQILEVRDLKWVPEGCVPSGDGSQESGFLGFPASEGSWPASLCPLYCCICFPAPLPASLLGGLLWLHLTTVITQDDPPISKCLVTCSSGPRTSWFRSADTSRLL